MNDCLWCFICDCCENCRHCDKYLSVNTPRGEALLEEYDKEVNERLKPLIEEWRLKMNEYTAD